MRSTSAVYCYACEAEGCVTHSEFVTFFHDVDAALDFATDERDGEATEVLSASAAVPPPSALLSLPSHTDAVLLAFRPSLRFPTHLVLSDTYLGDAGTAAFFRMLPMLRWMQVVEARNVGAGPRSVQALCHAIVSDVVLDSDTDKDEEGGAACGLTPVAASEAEEPRSLGQLPALALVDLRQNNGIFACSAQKLISAMARRRAELLRWVQGQTPEVDLRALPALEVYVDEASLPPTIAQALQLRNAEAVRAKRHREKAAAERRWHEQLRVFAAPENKHASSPAMQSSVWPTGEHVILRLDAGNPDSEQASAPLAELRGTLNAHMESFLLASRLLCPDQPQATTGTLYLQSIACGALAALQATVELGADTLSALPHTSARLFWSHGCGAVGAEQQAEKALEAQPSQRVKQKYEEVKAMVEALLHGLAVNPQIEKELAVSIVSGGATVEEHLRQLRQLSANLPSRAASKNSLQKHTETLTRVYDRVVTAAVTPRFTERHLPCMTACERRLEEITRYVLDHLVTGTCDADALMERVHRLRANSRHHTDTAGIFPKATRTASPTSPPQETTRLLPPIMVACHYHLMHHPEREDVWKQLYDGVTRVGEGVPVGASTADESTDIPDAMKAFHSCRCAEKLAAQHGSENDTEEALPSPALPQPCVTCCYQALKAVEAALKASEEATEEDELRARWHLLGPVRQAFPRALRVFFLDMLVRRHDCSNGGSTHLSPPPAVARERGGGEGSDAPRTMLSWIARSHDHRAHWEALLRTFAPWYRLRALECGGDPKRSVLL